MDLEARTDTLLFLDARTQVIVVCWSGHSSHGEARTDTLPFLDAKTRVAVYRGQDTGLGGDGARHFFSQVIGH